MPVVPASPLAPTREADDEEDDEDARAIRDDEATRAAAGLPDLVDPIAETLAALRRKGFGRLFVDGRR